MTFWLHWNGSNVNSYSASHDNWCTATLWNRIVTAQCEGMGEVGSARYEPALLPPCSSIRALTVTVRDPPNHTSSLRVNKINVRGSELLVTQDQWQITYYSHHCMGVVALQVRYSASGRSSSPHPSPVISQHWSTKQSVARHRSFCQWCWDKGKCKYDNKLDFLGSPTLHWAKKPLSTSKPPCYPVSTPKNVLFPGLKPPANHWCWWPFTLIITLVGARAITKVSGHQHQLLAGGYDLEIGHV